MILKSRALDLTEIQFETKTIFLSFFEFFQAKKGAKLFETIKVMFKKLLETFSSDTRKQGFRFNWNLIWNKNNFFSFFEPFQAKKGAEHFEKGPILM